MGTDIHGFFQKRASRGDAYVWEAVETQFDFDRHYQLFAVLAGVRNGYGFAGISTGSAVEPISEPRGLPNDLIYKDHTVTLPFPDRYGDYECWLGDHSHSWLTGEEMMIWFERDAPTVLKTGVISLESFKKWDGNCPYSYSGDVGGRGVVILSEKEATEMLSETDGETGTGTSIADVDNNNYYVRIYWQSDLREELGYFFDEVKRLTEEHGQIRLVFGFDS